MKYYFENCHLCFVWNPLSVRLYYQQILIETILFFSVYYTWGPEYDKEMDVIKMQMIETNYAKLTAVTRIKKLKKILNR